MDLLVELYNGAPWYGKLVVVGGVLSSLCGLVGAFAWSFLRVLHVLEAHTRWPRLHSLLTWLSGYSRSPGRHGRRSSTLDEADHRRIVERREGTGSLDWGSRLDDFFDGRQ